MNILQLSHYLDDLLDIHNIDDAPGAFNGLQVESTGEVLKIALAVDACDATIDMAIDRDCDLLFVHHGLFWGGSQPVCGKMYKKIAALIQNNVALYSAHIPLDVHPVLGNNKALADMAGLKRPEPFGEYRGMKIGLKGTIPKQPAGKLAKSLSKQLGVPVRAIGDGEVKTLGLVSGGAGDMVGQAVQEGLDAYLTGECSNHHFHEAVEGGCVLLLAGHYATETGGVKAVGEHLRKKFGLKTEYLDYPTGL